MDLETENRIASILLKEAAELRCQAQEEGVLAYLHKPTVRGRPNSRFLNATVRGIEQANRVVEVNEMWRARQKELEMDGRSKSRRDEGSRSSRDTNTDLSRNGSKRVDSNAACSSSKRTYGDRLGEDSSLKDEEIEAFLQSRAKRGRGSVGSRINESGPYLPTIPESQDYVNDERPRQVHLGPERPSSSMRCEHSDSESDDDEQKRSKRNGSGRSKKKDSKKYKSKDRDRRKRKKGKRRYKH